MISNIHTLNPSSYTNFINKGVLNEKIVVPVSPSMVIYSQLEHISGIASSSNSGNVNMSKIRILNTLIDRLTDMKQQIAIPKDESVLSDTQVDALIKDYENKISTTISTAQQNPYALQGGTIPKSGSFFSFAA